MNASITAALKQCGGKVFGAGAPVLGMKPTTPPRGSGADYLRAIIDFGDNSVQLGQNFPIQLAHLTLRGRGLNTANRVD
jgi:hypothetical protein